MLARTEHRDWLGPVNIPPALRDDLITYLFCTSPDRARLSRS
jgi:hypothetical protein